MIMRTPWQQTHRMHAEKRPDNGNAFVPDPGSGPARVQDDLAELAAEEFIASATAGEETTYEDRDRVAPEEYGGPYLEERIPEELLKLLRNRRG
jgi:hypothetical protein